MRPRRPVTEDSADLPLAPVIQGPVTAPANGSITFTFGGIPLDSLSGSNTASPFLTTNSAEQIIGSGAENPY